MLPTFGEMKGRADTTATAAGNVDMESAGFTSAATILYCFKPV